MSKLKKLQTKVLQLQAEGFQLTVAKAQIEQRLPQLMQMVQQCQREIDILVTKKKKLEAKYGDT